jgi:hypothetical protein
VVPTKTFVAMVYTLNITPDDLAFNTLIQVVQADAGIMALAGLILKTPEELSAFNKERQRRIIYFVEGFFKDYPEVIESIKRRILSEEG